MLDFHLEGDLHILGHLGMSGSWRLGPEKIDVKHTHLQFKGIDGSGATMYLAYVDPRRFGNIYFFKNKKAQEHINKLGIDIASPDFTAEYIYQVCKRFPERQLKAFLLDQKYFAGCGNYIACEICARSGIRPTRKCAKVSKADAKRIELATANVLEGQIKRKGLTFSGGYSDAFGDKGEGLSDLVVFHQTICGLCAQETVKKIVLAQRGTYYCSSCQK
jgi:formamidopyrimidine-DNA glycosylase